MTANVEKAELACKEKQMRDQDQVFNLPVREVHRTEKGVLVRAEDGRAAWVGHDQVLDGNVHGGSFEYHVDPSLSLVPVALVKTASNSNVLVQAEDGRKAWVRRDFLEALGEGKGLTRKLFEEKAKEFAEDLKKWNAQLNEKRAHDESMVDLGKVKLSDSGKAVSVQATFTNSKKCGPDGAPKASTMRAWFPLSQLTTEGENWSAPFWLIKKKVAELVEKMDQDRSLKRGRGMLTLAEQRFSYDSSTGVITHTPT